MGLLAFIAVIAIFFWPTLLLNVLPHALVWVLLLGWWALCIWFYVYTKRRQCLSVYTTAFGNVRCSGRAGHTGAHSGSRETGRKGWRGQKSVTGKFSW